VAGLADLGPEGACRKCSGGLSARPTAPSAEAEPGHAVGKPSGKLPPKTFDELPDGR
jgi:hypothetical protein